MTTVRLLMLVEAGLGGGGGGGGGEMGFWGEEGIRKDVKPQTSITSRKCSVGHFRLHADRLRLVPEVLHVLACTGQRQLVSSTEQHTPGDLRS